MRSRYLRNSGVDLSKNFEFGIPESRFPISGITDETYRVKRFLSPAHAVKKFAIVFSGLEFAEQELSGFKFIHRIKQFSQDPYLLQNILLQQ